MTTKITHRSAVDNIADGISTTHCGLVFSLYDDNAPIDNKPTCEECKKEFLKTNSKSTEEQKLRVLRMKN
jgi:hypothetical protein